MSIVHQWSTFDSTSQLTVAGYVGTGHHISRDNISLRTKNFSKMMLLAWTSTSSIVSNFWKYYSARFISIFEIPKWHQINIFPTLIKNWAHKRSNKVIVECDVGMVFHWLYFDLNRIILNIRQIIAILLQCSKIVIKNNDAQNNNKTMKCYFRNVINSFYVCHWILIVYAIHNIENVSVHGIHKITIREKQFLIFSSISRNPRQIRVDVWPVRK